MVSKEPIKMKSVASGRKKKTQTEQPNKNPVSQADH